MTSLRRAPPSGDGHSSTTIWEADTRRVHVPTGCFQYPSVGFPVLFLETRDGCAVLQFSFQTAPLDRLVREVTVICEVDGREGCF